MQQFISEIMRDASGYLEIREIDGGDSNKVKQRFIRPMHIDSYRPPMDKNVYFGVYGRVEKSGKAKSCNATKALWADYDADMEGLTVAERAEKIMTAIKRVDLPDPSILVSSGNGIHAYWLLNERQRDVTDILRAIAGATGGDLRATDRARIMRLPGTFNVKDRPLRCEILQADYSLIYDIRLFRDKLRDYMGAADKKPIRVRGNVELVNDILGIEPDRHCIKAILRGVPEGERNFMLGRLTKWLQLRGYTKEKSKRVILAWNNLNRPPEDKDKVIRDFNLYWHGDYKLLGCMMKNPGLQQILYKYCNRPECKFTMAIGNISLENSIKYNNRLLKDLHRLTGNELIIYGLLVRHREGLTTSLLIEKLTSRATGEPCMSKPTRIKSLNTLRKAGFIEKTEGNRRAGREDLHTARAQGTYGMGYTLITNGAINGAIDKRVTPGELRLYILLLKFAFNKGSCYPSLATMAKELRTSEPRISNQLLNLERVDYIKRNYRSFNGVEKLDISLLV